MACHEDIFQYENQTIEINAQGINREEMYIQTFDTES